MALAAPVGRSRPEFGPVGRSTRGRGHLPAAVPSPRVPGSKGQRSIPGPLRVGLLSCIHKPAPRTVAIVGRHSGEFTELRRSSPRSCRSMPRLTWPIALLMATNQISPSNRIRKAHPIRTTAHIRACPADRSDNNEFVHIYTKEYMTARTACITSLLSLSPRDIPSAPGQALRPHRCSFRPRARRGRY